MEFGLFGFALYLGVDENGFCVGFLAFEDAFDVVGGSDRVSPIESNALLRLFLGHC